MTLNRREFLQGLAAALVVAGVPIHVTATPNVSEWTLDLETLDVVIDRFTHMPHVKYSAFCDAVNGTQRKNAFKEIMVTHRMDESSCSGDYRTGNKQVRALLVEHLKSFIDRENQKLKGTI